MTLRLGWTLVLLYAGVTQAAITAPYPHRRHAPAPSAQPSTGPTATAAAAGTGNSDSTPGDEFEKKIHAAEQVSPLGSDFTGEKVSLYDGSTSFEITDVSLPGNNSLPVRIARRFKVEDRHGKGYLPGFGDWEIDIPRIHGTFLADRGWKLQGASPYARCTTQALPDVATSGLVMNPYDVWHSNYLALPGQGDQELLVNDQPKLPAITDGQTYPWVTSGLARVRCLTTTANGYPGEAFVALGNDGTQYTFNYVVSSATHAIRVATNDNKNQVSVGRIDVSFLITRMQDRFGNWVVYDYSGSNLVGIRASDGRAITVTWNGAQIQSVTANGRTWTYAYTPVTGYAYAVTLNRVTQPDGSAWTYSGVGTLKPLREAPLDGGANYLICPVESDPRYDYVGYHLTVGHPSGASAVYDFEYARTYRSHTPVKQCSLPLGQRAPIPYAAHYWDGYGLTDKTISGAGLATQHWSYVRYDAGTQFYTTGTASDPCPSCPQSKLVTVTAPDGGYQQYTFGILYGLNEGRILQVDRGIGTAAALSTTTTQYVTTAELATQAFPDVVGTSRNLVYSFDNRLRPTKQTVTTQDGATFASTANSYDAMGRTLSITKSSSLGYSKTDTTTYYDDLAKWVVGQTASASTNGIEASRTNYDPASDLPIATYAFGKLQQTLTYNTDGTVATAKDGNNNVTTLSSWYRGVPRNIGHADGTTQSAIVNDNGWITSTTDENGYQSSYQYDLLGRLTRIVYPTADSTVWNDTTITLALSLNPVYGLPAGHWRQTVQTGNARTITFLDALFRPIVKETYDAANINGTLAQTVSRYDASGRRAFVSYPQRNLDPAVYNTWADPAKAPNALGTRTTYDALDRATRVEQDSELGVLATTTEYLPGFQMRSTNPRGFQSTMAFMAYDQPRTDWPTSITQSEGKTIQIWRDAFGKPTRVRQSGTSGGVFADQSRYYVYDGNQQLCKTIEPETGATVMDYDAAGNVQWTASGVSLPSPSSCDTIAGRDSGRKVTRYYDPRNRVSSLSFPDGFGSQSWTYTPDGLPQQITTTNDRATTVVNAYTYNKRRMLTGESVNQPGWYTWGIGYGYDANGSLAGQQYPTGLYVDYAPNALGQATKVGSYATGVSYYPNGGIAQFTYGNGLVHTMLQNSRQLPGRSTDGGGALDLGYSYDADANVSAIWDYARDTGNGFYGRWMNYDGLDRLTAAGSCTFGGDCWHRFTYDALDNIKSWKLGGVKDYANYYYDASNRLTNIQNSSGASLVGLGYDAQGNLANKNGKFYSFDYGNRLRATNEEWYRYDGRGRRVLNWRATESGVLSQYSQSGALVYDENYRASGHKATEYVYLGKSLVATHERNIDTGAIAVKYQHTDALGSPVAVTNEAGQVIDRTQYEPFGVTISKPAYDGIGYAGHVMDGATGLTYMQQRYYDPGIGRFLSVDPIAADGNTGAKFNRYAYALDNPYKFTDPDGRTELNPVMERLFPEGDTFRAAGESFGALAALGVGLATGDTALQNTAIDGMRENISASDGINAAAILVSPRSGEGKTSTTYTRTNAEGVVYSGKTSGKGTPEQQVAARTGQPDHQAKTAGGYGPGVVDKNSPNANAIRGREQQLINRNGGAQSQGGASGNKINSVSPSNPQRETYQKACTKEFGC